MITILFSFSSPSKEREREKKNREQLPFLKSILMRSIFAIKDETLKSTDLSEKQETVLV